MLIRIEKDWNHPNFKRQSPNFSAVWEGITFTDEPVDECDVLAVFNSPNRDIRVRCPTGNRWLFTQESPIEIYRWQTDSFKYFDKVFSYWNNETSPNIIHRQTSLPWHIGRSYDELQALSLEQSRPHKEKLISWVTSNATHKGGHKLRMAFKDFLEKEQFPFDLFGRGFSPIDDKFDGIFPYKYSFAIENYACNDYWTEKIADCFLSWTMPIYWGAPNILSYFPRDSMIVIDPNNPQAAIRTIREAIESNRFERNAAALAEARDLVLNKYQLFPHLCSLMAEYGVSEACDKPRCFIPTNPEHYKGETKFGAIRRLLKRHLVR